MTSRGYLVAGALLAPIAGIATGIWAEFADLSPPLLLTVTMPTIMVSLLCVSRLIDIRDAAEAGGRGIAGGLKASPTVGAAIGLLTFAISAGLYVAIHYLASGGFDVNDEESGGSAIVFFAVHVGVGAVVGLAVGLVVALVGYVVARKGRGETSPPLRAPLSHRRGADPE